MRQKTIITKSLQIVRLELETPTQCLEYREIGINWEDHWVHMWLGTELCKFLENKT